METAILWHTGALIDDLEITQVHQLAQCAHTHDGVAPLSEQTLLNLRVAGDDVVHLLTWYDRELAGYAQVDLRGAAPSAELVVRPARRRRGLGYHLLAGAMVQVARTPLPATAPVPPVQLLDDIPQLYRVPSDQVTPPPSSPLLVWAHGDLPPARALAAKAGFAATRELLLLHAPLGAPPVVQVPPGWRLRPFHPGADDEAWVRLNARAFADHPEQGRWTVHDLHARMGEEWFDPAGFLLLERTADGAGADADPHRLPGGHGPVGFVWTKIERSPGHPVIGELFVVGLDPAAQGHGLGRLLTAAGLAHLARAGATAAHCYVDGTNTAAVKTYQRAGFTRLATDVQYAELGE